MNRHLLRNNPFYILRATPRDADVRLIERALEVSLLTGKDTAKVQEALLKPVGRLEAEIAFLPGVDEEELGRLRNVIGDGQPHKQMNAGDLFFRPASVLALLNGAAALLEGWRISDAESAAAAALGIAGICSRIRAARVMAEINEDRNAGGRVPLENEGEVRIRLRQHERELISLLCGRIGSLPGKEAERAQELLTDAYCDAKGPYYRNSALDEMVSVHLAGRNAGQTAGIREKILKCVSDYNAFAAEHPPVFVVYGMDASRKADGESRKRESMILELTEAMHRWDHLTKQARRIIQVKGYTQEDSHALFLEIHQCFVNMYNKVRDFKNARTLIRALHDVFWDLQPADRETILKNAAIARAKLD